MAIIIGTFSTNNTIIACYNSLKRIPRKPKLKETFSAFCYLMWEDKNSGLKHMARDQ